MMVTNNSEVFLGCGCVVGFLSPVTRSYGHLTPCSKSSSVHNILPLGFKVNKEYFSEGHNGQVHHLVLLVLHGCEGRRERWRAGRRQGV